MQCDTVSWIGKKKGGRDMSEDKMFESDHLTQMPDMPIPGSGHGHKVTFKSLVMRPGSVSSTAHLVPQLVSFNLSGTPNTETSGKDTDSKAEGMPNIGTRSDPNPHHQKIRRTWQDASIVMHSLQLVAEEFRKICIPKIQKWKGGYLANAMLVFNSWLKDMDMYLKELTLTNLEAVQLIKNYTTEVARGVVEIYLDTNSTWDYQELIGHLRTLF